jgi:hypothetical protein
MTYLLRDHKITKMAWRSASFTPLYTDPYREEREHGLDKIAASPAPGPTASARCSSAA